MKFTEGFWVRSERANASYASQGFYAKKTAYGMQIVAPERQVLQLQEKKVITASFSS